MDTDVTGASSPSPEAAAPVLTAVDAAVVAGDQSAFSKARRAERAGTHLAAQPADPAAAPPVDQAASTDASAKPASEPAKGKGAKARTADLDAEIKDLQEKLRLRATLREELARDPKLDAQPAASSPATDPAKPPTQAEWARYKAMPDAPKLDAFERFEDWTAAMSVFVADQRYDERRQADRADEAKTAGQRHAQQAMTRLETAGQAKHADFEQKALAFDQAGHRFNPLISDVLLNHPLGHELAYEFFSNPEEFTRISAIRHPAAAFIELGRLVARLDGATPRTPPLKTITDAPPPATTLGSKPAERGDPMASALASDSLPAFRAAKRARGL